MKRAFVTTAIYALGRQLGVVAAMAEFQKQVQAPNAESLPVARTIARLRHLTDVGLDFDVGATIVGQMRSRCFHRAYTSGWESWISLDDDIEASTETCARMLDALDDVQPRIVLAPYLIRTSATGEPRMSVRIPTVRITRLGNPSLIRLPYGHGGGFGLCGMNRLAMKRMVETHAGDDSIRWNDEDDGGEKLALFHDLLEGGMWFGEDTSFFRRVPPSISVEVLLVGTISHAGNKLDLDLL